MNVLDPTDETRPAQRPINLRPEGLDGLVVGLLDISKDRGDVFLDRIEEVLHERDIVTKRFSKPTYAKPAPVDLRQEIAEQCHVVIEALAD